MKGPVLKLKMPLKKEEAKQLALQTLQMKQKPKEASPDPQIILSNKRK